MERSFRSRVSRFCEHLWGGGSPPLIDERVLRVYGIRSQVGYPLVLGSLGLVLAYHVFASTLAPNLWLDYGAIWLTSWLGYCGTVAFRFGYSRQTVGPILASAMAATVAGVWLYATRGMAWPRAMMAAVLAWPLALLVAGLAAGWGTGLMRQDEAWQFAQGLGMRRGLLLLLLLVLFWSFARLLLVPDDDSFVVFFLATLIPAALGGIHTKITGCDRLDEREVYRQSATSLWPTILSLAVFNIVVYYRRRDVDPVSMFLGWATVSGYLYWRHRNLRLRMETEMDQQKKA